MDVFKWLYVLIFVLYRESLCTDNVESRKYGERIVGGQETDIEFHPYQVFIDIGCGGSIIGRRWILTAKHCNMPNMTTVYAGSSTREEGTPYKIRSAVEHPLFFTSRQFSENAAYYDFMLLELNKPLVYGPKVRPIEIGKEEDIVAGKYGITTGYGMTKPNGTRSPVLRGVAVPIMDLYKCNQIYPDTILPIVICVGYPQGGKSACMGDSGGPLVVDGKLLGVTSYGRHDCGLKGNPGVYGSVPKVRSWISRVTGI